jgi:hypothetical protein
LGTGDNGSDVVLEEDHDTDDADETAHTLSNSIFTFVGDASYFQLVMQYLEVQIKMENDDVYF